TDPSGIKVACHPKLWGFRAKGGGADRDRTHDLLNAIIPSLSRATEGSPRFAATVLVTNVSAGRLAAPYRSRSKRSLFMTLSHATTKSRTNFSFESPCA